MFVSYKLHISKKPGPFGLFIAGAHAAYIVATGATYGLFRSQGLNVLLLLAIHAFE